MAQLVAAREAILFAVEAGSREIIFEGDNIGVVNAIREYEDGLVSVWVIIVDIGKVSGNCSKFSCSFIKREGNGVARLLARFANSIFDCVV